MTIALAILILFVAAFLLVRLRLRVDLSPERRIVFLGLGRTGPEIDFVRREIRLRLSGIRIKSFLLDREAPVPDVAEAGESKRRIERTSAKPKRRRSFLAVLDIVPQSLAALWKYFVGLLKAAIIEQAEGEIEAGFDAPHITGQVYGCYQVALAAAPSLMSRFRYTPVWTGPKFSGTLRVSIAWPVYRLLWQTMLLIWRLPKRKLVKLAIGEKKGDQYVK